MPSARLFIIVVSLFLVGCSVESGSGAEPATAVSPTATMAVPTATTAQAGTSAITAQAGTSTTSASSATSSSVPVGSCGTAAPPMVYRHVVWIWMENHRADDVLGSSPDTPFEHELARHCGSATRYQAVGSPSLPNYVAATSGDTQGIHDDASPTVHEVSADNLFRQVRAAGGTTRSYEEAMTGTCALRSAGRYAVKHNPQAYFADPDDRAACQRDNVPLGSLDAGPFHDDLATGHLPSFAFVTPDLCNDTHDCDVATGDRWLADWVGTILASGTYRAGSTVVFIVWDEPTPMPMLVIAPSAGPGVVSTSPWDHYSLLRTTEDLLGVGPPLGLATTASSMRSVFDI